MFLSNKYTKCYFLIINRANMENRIKGKTYFEKHHIIPKSCGGGNDSENLVLLTAKEHFICHLLLTKMCVEKNHYHKMLFALNSMSRQRGLKNAYYSRMYAYLRPKISKALSEMNKGKPKPGTSQKLKGRPKSPEHLEKLRANLRKINSTKNRNKIYKVIDIQGNETIVNNRAQFCNEHSLVLEEFSRAASSGKRYRGFLISILPV